jgi:hypothetical protein
MSLSSPKTASGPRPWLATALLLAGCLASAPAWCSPALRGARMPEAPAAAAAAVRTAVIALVDPAAWRWLPQLWIGLPWPISSGDAGRATRSPAHIGGSHGFGAAAPSPSSAGDPDDGGTQGSDPNG